MLQDKRKINETHDYNHIAMNLRCIDGIGIFSMRNAKQFTINKKKTINKLITERISSHVLYL